MKATMYMVMRKGCTANDLCDFGNCNVEVKKQTQREGFTTVTLRGEYMHLVDVYMGSVNFVCWSIHKSANLLDSGSV